MPRGFDGGDQELGEFRETHIKTRRAVRTRGEVVYGADIETTRMAGDGQFVTESHTGGAEAACGCLIEGNLKPRFHRNGTMVCQNHYYFCGVCSQELLALDLVVIERRVYCKACGEKAIDELLWVEYRHPGSFEKAFIAHLKVQKVELRNQRWKRAFNRIFRRRELPR